MPNDFTPDDRGQIEIPFQAFIVARVAWFPEQTNDEIYDKAHEKIREVTPDWEIDDETLSTWQGELPLSDLDVVIHDLLKGDFKINDCANGNYQWTYRSFVSREFVTKTECFSDFVISKLNDLDVVLGINLEED